jgi:hypothetical protein
LRISGLIADCRSSIVDSSLRLTIRNPQSVLPSAISRFGNSRPIIHRGLLLTFLLAPAFVFADTRLRVEFTDKGDCSVVTAGPSGRSAVRYPRQSAEFRCAVTSVGDPGAVDLEVVAPPGAGRPASSFPQLTWTEENGRWTGRARVPSPPAFVRLVPFGSARERWLDATVLVAAAAATLWSLAFARGSRT